MNAQEINKWLITDDPEFYMNDNDIVQSVLHDFSNTPSLEGIKEPEEKIFYNTAYSALQISLKFFKETARCNFVGKWCYFAEKKELESPNERFDQIFSNKIICFMYTYLRCFILK